MEDGAKKYVIEDEFRKKVEEIFDNDFISKTKDLVGIIKNIFSGDTKEKFSGFPDMMKGFIESDSIAKMQELLKGQNKEERAITEEKIKQVLKERTKKQV